MKYPNVKNAHVVPATYLRNWAVDGKVAVWLLPDGKRLAEQPVEKVGTRRRFYERERPRTGEKINDVEWTLAEIESNAGPLLRSFEDAWPFSGEDKLKLAVLFAFQHLRTPRWKQEYASRTRRFLDRYDAENPGSLSPAELEEQNAEVLSDTQRLIQMISTGISTSGIFASMHWTLIEFGSPIIATSDHPVVLWEGVGSRSPQTTEITQIGILNCIEIRLPLSPTHAVLMTWSDHSDDEHVRTRGTRDHAANLNAFTVESADRQWFHRPGATTPRASGNLRPLSIGLVPDYTAVAATNSRRRQSVSTIANQNIPRELSDREITVVTMSRPKRS